MPATLTRHRVPYATDSQIFGIRSVAEQLGMTEAKGLAWELSLAGVCDVANLTFDAAAGLLARLQHFVDLDTCEDDLPPAQREARQSRLDRMWS